MPSGKWIVALDGPAGAGKSTLSRLLADRLGFALVDTGAIYRCIAMRAASLGIGPEDDARLGPLAATVDIRFQMKVGRNHVFLDGVDVTDAIRTPEQSMAASKYSARPVVREALLGLQRRLALDAPQPGAVLEGRDIGTVVFPDAEVKVFVTASVMQRAQRRHAELAAKGPPPTLEKVMREIEARDRQDTERATAPLRQAPDASTLDTTDLSVEEIVGRLERLVEASRKR